MADSSLIYVCRIGTAHGIITGMVIKDFQEAVALLNSFVPRPIDIRASYNLNTPTKLAALFDNPQDKLRVIHVAGTSGKTSTSYYATALLQAAGKKTGLTVSPHMVALNDRVQIDGKPLDQATFLADLGEYIERVRRTDLRPTYYELMMVFAYYEFAKYSVDYAVIEVGLGGLLDGSNIVTRADKTCVITDIGLDHTAVLGDTIAAIAAQKAGIIHEGNDVFCYRQTPEAAAVIAQVTTEKQAKLYELDDAAVASDLAFLPEYQKRNFGLAEAVVRHVLARDASGAIADEQRQAAAKIHVPGRMEHITKDGKTIVLDGAHNPQKLTAFAQSFDQQFPGTKPTVLIGFVASKELALPENARILSPIAARIIVTGFDAEQCLPHAALSPEQVAAAFAAQGLETEVIPNPQKALAALLADENQTAVITGSLYLVSYLRSKLQQAA